MDISDSLPPMPIHSLNHFSRETRNVQRLSDFYKNVLGFIQLSRPPFDFEGTWLAIPNLYIPTPHDPSNMKHPSATTVSLHIMERLEDRIPVNDSVFGDCGKWKFETGMPDPVNIGRSHHIALRTENMETVLKILEARKIPYNLRVIPGSGGVRQLFFYDPDGNGVEIGEFAFLQPAFQKDELVDSKIDLTAMN
ncbi:hypothetical protein SmJEL517_g01291 [Synchytrium microbalum]|uniref:VOC domain-containing protein n=1 Tax=Synchytrium microbalum TaxID=1806994 RepID=A0A507CBR0_9FUNG|nr:uncharacterized protein SmJEL517_g01291 [Synchytrium microbalum]TPX36589.1 hypothetical protein SmJEL517_g01291 [Synchytrium microbalum]